MSSLHDTVQDSKQQSPSMLSVQAESRAWQGTRAPPTEAGNRRVLHRGDRTLQKWAKMTGTGKVARRMHGGNRFQVKRNRRRNKSHKGFDDKVMTREQYRLLKITEKRNKDKKDK